MADDDDVLDSWEDAIDTEVLEKRMEEREKALQEKEREEAKQNNCSSVKILKQENTGRTEYAPQIKILKRENSPQIKRQVNNVAPESAKPAKTLAEREAEYAAARARILGSASYEETENVPSLLTSKDNEQQNSISSTNHMASGSTT